MQHRKETLRRRVKQAIPYLSTSRTPKACPRGSQGHGKCLSRIVFERRIRARERSNDVDMIWYLWWMVSWSFLIFISKLAILSMRYIHLCQYLQYLKFCFCIPKIDEDLMQFAHLCSFSMNVSWHLFITLTETWPTIVVQFFAIPPMRFLMFYCFLMNV